VSTTVDPTARQVWRAVRGPLILGALILLTGAVLAYLGRTEGPGNLDPSSPSPTGSRALAQLLRAQGVDVHIARTTDEAVRQAGADATLLVAFPELLQRSQYEALRPLAGRIVLLGPSQRVLDALGLDAEASGHTAPETLKPSCDHPAAQRAGDADLGGQAYRLRTPVPQAHSCYPAEGAAKGAASLLIVPGQPHETVLVGRADPFRNAILAEHGNASLTMQLLGAEPRLVWYLPSLSDPAAGTGDRTFMELLPLGWRWAFLQLAIGVVLLAVWRARRLGPVVPEPLPVVIRATETVEGRARLYRRANARDHAARILREATLSRLTLLLGLDRHADADTVVYTVAMRTAGSSDAVRALLYGVPPGDDDALVRLADDLDTIEREVRRS